MKAELNSLSLVACFFIIISVGCQPDSSANLSSDKLILKGPYLGMTPPGDTPVIFAPGIVSSVYWEHSGAVFTPDGNELFWSVAINEGRNPRIIVILHMQRVDGIWTEPELAPFNTYTYNHINSISPDGKRLYYFTSSDDEPSRARMVEKTDTGWGEPRLLRLNTVDNPGTVVNEVHETRSGNIYCSGPIDSIPGGRGIVRSRLEDGRYQQYESLGSAVNMPLSVGFPNHSPTVDPDEKFVIFVSRRPGGFGEQDLYISYRQEDDTWGEAINLGAKINSIGTGVSWPQLSPDGKYLFFTVYDQPLADFGKRQYTLKELTEIQESIMNGWGNIYWVDTSFVEKLRR